MILQLHSKKQARTKQYSRGEYKLKQNGLIKSDENYFHRKKFYKTSSTKLCNFGSEMNKGTINNLYWSFSANKYNYGNIRTR